MKKRIPTYIAGFDSLIGGGFFENSHVLISGSPGSGKTIFCLQILYNRALKGDKCLFITLEETKEAIENQMHSFNWEIDKVSKNFKIVSLFEEDGDVFAQILKIAKGFNIIAIDSLVSVIASPVSEKEVSSWDMMKVANSVFPIPKNREETFRMQIKRIIRELKKLNILVFYTSEMPLTHEWLSRDTVSEFLCDAVIMLALKYVLRNPFYSLQVLKFRSTKINSKEQLINFTNKGIVVSTRK